MQPFLCLQSMRFFYFFLLKKNAISLFALVHKCNINTCLFPRLERTTRDLEFYFAFPHIRYDFRPIINITETIHIARTMPALVLAIERLQVRGFLLFVCDSIFWAPLLSARLRNKGSMFLGGVLVDDDDDDGWSQALHVAMSLVSVSLGFSTLTRIKNAYVLASLDRIGGFSY